LVQFDWLTYALSIVAVLISAMLAAVQGNFRRRPGLDMGFVNHGGMWGDLLLLPIANAAIVPHLRVGPWLALALPITFALSCWVHVHWYRGRKPDRHSHEHMWPSHARGAWWRDLSWAGWAHVVYVAGELAILIGFLVFPVPSAVIALVALIFTLHVPLGLLQPRWFLTGEIAGVRKQPLLVPLLTTLWFVCVVKS
jgi:hypothetical protein